MKKITLALLCFASASCTERSVGIEYDNTETPNRFAVFEIQGSNKEKYEVTFTWGRTIAIPGDHDIYVHINPENEEIPSSEVVFSSGNRRELRNIKLEAKELHDTLIFNYFGVTGPKQQESLILEINSQGIPQLRSLRLTIEGAEQIIETNEYIGPDSRRLGTRLSPSYDELLEIYRRGASFMKDSKTKNTEPGGR